MIMAAVPKEGTSGWTDRFFKVRGTRHDDLANLFSNYLLEKETQDRFLTKSMVFMSRKDVAVPDHWKDYPRSNEEVHRRFQLISMKGWEKITADYAGFDSRMKLAISRSGTGSIGSVADSASGRSARSTVPPAASAPRMMYR